MRIIRYSALLIAVTLLVSCAEELVDQSFPNKQELATITASISDTDTKASVTSRGEFYWNSGDKIDVYTDTERFLEFSIESGVGTKTAKFSGDLEENEGISTIAIYPTGLSPIMEGEGVSINLPAEYELEDDNLVCKTPMVAEIEDNGAATFKHVAGLLRFTFIGIPEEATKLSISADTDISGKFTINTGIITTQSASTPNGVSVNLGQFYNTRDIVVNIPVPTGDYDEINITFLDEAGNVVYEKESTKDRTISAGEIYAFNPIVISHPYIDLGLPSGTLWAEYNVGASSPDEYGDYFSYGETSPKNWYSSDTYTFDKALAKGENLALEDDAAYVNWGEDWRMPTKDDWHELIDNCSVVETTYNGVKGRMFTGPNRNKLFLPHAGMYFSDNEDWCIGSGAQYLSSTCESSWSCYVLETLWGLTLTNSDKSYGRPLRAVLNSSSKITLTPAISLEVGKKSTLNVTNATESVVWTSADESIATVTSSGEVTAVAEGKVEIKATIGSVVRSCEVTVVQKPSITISEYMKSGIFMNGYIFSGSSITWSLKNNSTSVANIVSAQIIDEGSSYYGNVMDINETIFAGDFLGYTITFNRNTPLTSYILFTIEYNGHLFEYKGTIRQY